MATATLGGALSAARQLDPPDADGDLLRRFAATRDDAAFAHLVARYGRLVLAACRRIVPDSHLADDAFQASFLVLAKKADSLDARRPLAPWLYGVACHVSRRARAMLGRRRKRETLTDRVPDVHASSSSGTGCPAGDDATHLLDEEIGKLSPAYRDAVVLCELQGLTRKAAAGKLGIAEGTLSSRLAAARKALAARLRARGVAPAAVGAAVLVPTDLFAETVALSTGKVEFSAHLADLVKGGMAVALLSKLKLAPVLVAVALLVVGVGGWGAKRDTATAAPAPKADKDSGLIWTHHTKTNVLTAYAPDGKKAKEAELPANARFIGFTPDGTRMMFVGMKGKLPLPDADGPLTLHVGDISGKCEGTDTGLGWQEYDEFVWSPDGRQVVRSRREANGERPMITFSHTLFDIGTRKETAVDLPARHQLMQWSADGKTWRVMHYNHVDDPKLPSYRWLSMPAGGGDLTPVCDDDSFLWLDPHPDGKRFLVAPVRSADVTPGEFTLGTIAEGKMKTHADVEAEVEGVVCADARWSPSGDRMTALWYGIGTDKQRLGDTLLAVFDGEGKDKKTLLTLKADGQRTRLLGWFPNKTKAAPDPRRKNAPVPKEKPEGTITLVTNGAEKPIEVVTPDGEPVRAVAPDGWTKPYIARHSPDGKRILWSDRLPEDDRKKFTTPWRVQWIDLEAKRPQPKTVAEEAYIRSAAWSPDGKRVYYSRVDAGKLLGPPRRGEPLLFETWEYELATGKKTLVKLPPEQAVLEVSSDGKALLTRTSAFETDRQTMHLVPLNTLKPEPLGESPVAVVYSPRFSPDGKRVLYSKITDGPGGRPKLDVCVLDLTTKKEVLLTLPDELTVGGVYHLAWSPDGKRIALHWHEGGTGKGDRTASRVTVCDADGANPKLIVKRKPGELIVGLDWR